MKFVCYKEFEDPEEPTYPGILYKDHILPLARVAAVAEACHPVGLTVHEDLNQLIAHLPGYVPALKELEKNKLIDKIWPEVGVSPTAPLPVPHRILGVLANYVDHARETDHNVPVEPIFFQKTSTCVIGPESPIILPPDVGRVDYEGELAVVIGKVGRNITETEALGFVAGYTLINDVTARDEQTRLKAQGYPWFVAKSYDTFGPLGPCLVTVDEIRNPQALEITTTVNGEVKQRARTADMVFSVAKLIAAISRRMTLFPGDVIATGTPSGIGPLKSGDTVEIHIPEIGTLSNPVVAEEY
ncbi:MAG: fumarylacetoacetate hydrolase family protein [Capsulimonadaceae bacterium]